MITHTTEPSATQSWHIDCDYQQLHTTLAEAAHHATQSGRAILASYIQPITWHDPIRIFSAAQHIGCADSFYWEQPSQQALVGLGSAALISTAGPSCFTDASCAWNNLRSHAIVRQAPGPIPACFSGPLLFGGFAFDPQAPHTNLWQDFPDGLLILPRILLARQSDCAALIINTLVQPSADIAHDAREIKESLNRLQQANEDTSSLPHENLLPPTHLDVQNLLPASTWMQLVADCVSNIQQGAYEKIVLARAIQATTLDSTAGFEVATILRTLRQNYPGAYLFALQRANHTFLGATPEQLVSVHGGHIQTMALAGTAPRGASEQEDQRIGEELLLSAKNQDEHNITLAMIREALATLCTTYGIAGEPRLLKLKNVQHLETAIQGELQPDRNVLDVVESLHPTPAVGGFPREAALSAIRSGEQLDRGWYAGPIGWLDMRGNGEFAVALRSALLAQNTATLFAGCGIVAGSDPQSEYEESCLKFEVILRALDSTNRELKHAE